MVGGPAKVVLVVDVAGVVVGVGPALAVVAGVLPLRVSGGDPDRQLTAATTVSSATTATIGTARSRREGFIGKILRSPGC